jgi:hypothetical protein
MPCLPFRLFPDPCLLCFLVLCAHAGTIATLSLCFAVGSLLHARATRYEPHTRSFPPQRQVLQKKRFSQTRPDAKSRRRHAIHDETFSL